jgi:hypothetical protein
MHTTVTHGVNCEARCDTCVNRICDRFDGKCIHGCIGGFNGDRCNLTGITILVQGADLSYFNAHFGLFSKSKICIFSYINLQHTDLDRLKTIVQDS